MYGVSKIVHLLLNIPDAVQSQEVNMVACCDGAIEK